LGRIEPAHPSPIRLWDHAGELAIASTLAKPTAIATLTAGVFVVLANMIKIFGLATATIAAAGRT
jgi:hypothetical protein